MDLSWLEEMRFLFLWNNYLQGPFCLILHQRLRLTNEFQNAYLWKVRKETIIQNVNRSPHCVISCSFSDFLIILTQERRTNVFRKPTGSAGMKSLRVGRRCSVRPAKNPVFCLYRKNRQNFQKYENSGLRHIPNMYTSIIYWFFYW